MADEPSNGALRGRDLIGLGGLLVGAIVVFTLLGLLVDHLAGSSPVGVIVGVFVGMGAGAAGFAARIRAAGV